MSEQEDVEGREEYYESENGQSKHKFSLRKKEKIIPVEGEDGTEKKLIVRELKGTERDSYLNRVGNRMKVVDGKPVGVRDFKGIQADLLAMSVFNEDGSPIPRKEIEDWPASLQTYLFDVSQKLSGIDKMAKEKAKND